MTGPSGQMSVTVPRFAIWRRAPGSVLRTRPPDALLCGGPGRT